MERCGIGVLRRALLGAVGSVIPVLRSIRALTLFWTIFLSYGFAWLLSRLLSRERMRVRWKRVHEKNALRLANGFSRLRGVFIKVGQVLSVVGTFLPRAYGEALERLQDKVPPRPFREVEGRLKEALGDDALSKFESFDREPLAAASLAQVHRAVTRQGQAVAVKVLYPGIESLIRRDLGVLRSIMPVVGRLFSIARFERVLEQLSAMLARETDYANERKNMERIRSIFAKRDDVVVPRVVGELTHAGVLTMTFEEGLKITDFDGLTKQGVDSEAVAKLLVECYFSMLLEHGVLHADPHPGNFLVRLGPQLVILDYGAVEEVTPSLSEGMKEVVLGAVTRNDEQVLSGLERMGFVAEGGDRELLARVGREYLKMLASVKITDFSQLDATVEKLTVDGYQQVRGQLREIMKSVEYPDGSLRGANPGALVRLGGAARAQARLAGSGVAVRFAGFCPQHGPGRGRSGGPGVRFARALCLGALAAAACGRPASSARSDDVPGRCSARARLVSDQPALLEVEMSCSGKRLSGFALDDDTIVSGNVVDERGRALGRDGTHFRFAAPTRQASVRYRVEYGSDGACEQSFDVALRRGKTLIAPVSTWLAHPDRSTPTCLSHCA